MANNTDDMLEAAQDLSAGQPNRGVEAVGVVLGPGPRRDAASYRHSTGAAPADPTEVGSEGVVDVSEAPYENADYNDVKVSQEASPAMLVVLAKNRAGTWWSSQRNRNPLWSFFCPSYRRLGWEERGKSKNIDCLICHA